MTIPNTCPNVDIMVDLEKHCWMDTIGLRPLTEKGDEWLQRSELMNPDPGEWLISRLEFEEWFYELCEISDVSLSVTMEPTS